MMSSHNLYTLITLETAALDTPNKVAVLVTNAPAKRASTASAMKILQSSHFAVLSYELFIHTCTSQHKQTKE
jgi:hypothetical protein